MTKNLFLFSAALLINACHGIACQAAVVVRSEINPTNGHVYHLLRSEQPTPDNPEPTRGVSWTEAEAAAVELGGHLVAVNDQAEHEWLLETFPGGVDGPLDYYIWIGLNDLQSEGDFVWSNGDALTFEVWFNNEPNDFDGGEDYVHIYNFQSGDFAWNDNKDVRIFNVNNFPFEFSAIAEIVPEPSSVLLLAFSGLLVGLLRLPCS